MSDVTSPPPPQAPGRPPEWLRRVGLSAWLLVGIVLLLVGAIWLAGQMYTIVGPIILGSVLAAVTGPAVAWLQRHRVPRPLGAALVLLAIVAVAAVIAALVVGGISGQASQIDTSTSDAAAKIGDYLEKQGIDSAADAVDTIKEQVPDIGTALLQGVAGSISLISSLALFLAFSIFATFFMLKDGPSMRAWAERNSGLSPAVARVVAGNVLRSLRQYFLAVTIVAAFNAVIIGLGALAFGVPLPATIAVVTLVTAYVPFLGAWTAGAFVFLLALSSQGIEVALVMALIVFMANGPLQQVVQPIAFGATLGLNPLVVLFVTIGGGALFGMAGLVLSAPLVSAAANIARELSELRAGEATASADGAPAPA